MAKIPKKLPQRKVRKAPANLLSNQGENASVAGIPMDEIRELVRSARQLRIIQETLLRSPGQSFFIYNQQTREFVFGEEETAALYGYTAEEVRSLPEGWASLYHPEEKKWMVGLQSKVLELGPESKPIEGEARIRCKDGHYEWISFHRRPLEWDAEGKLVTEIGVARIITREIEASQKVRESQQQYQHLFNQAPVAIFLTDPSGSVIEANRAAYADLRVAAQTLKGRMVLDFCANSGRRELRGALSALRSAKQPPPTIEIRFQRDDGTDYPVEVTLTKLGNENALVLARDLSEREREEKASREKEKCYQGLFVENPSGVAVISSKGAFLDANPALCRMLSLTAAELMTMTLPDVVSGSSRAATVKLIRQLAKAASDGTSVEIDLVCQKTGRAIPVEAFTGAIMDGNGRFDRGTITLNPIQARKETEAALLRESQLNAVLLENAPIAVALLSPEGRILRMNATAESLFGFRRDEVWGKCVWELSVMDAEEIAKSKRRHAQLLQGAKSVQASIAMRNRDGELRIVDVETTAVRTGGSVDYLIAIGIDQTERRRLESEVIRVAEAEQIRIGHDLHDGVGQTLTGIGSLMGALESDLEGAARQEVTRIRELVAEAIAENRRISHGLSPAAVKNRGLGGGLLLLAETIRRTFRTECECEIDPKVGWLPEEHAIHAFRIAQEAVSNAIRHGMATKITLRLVLRSPGQCGLEIIDNGNGFKVKDLRHDHGIGVRVMHYRADLIGGEILLRSAPGKGTKVVLEMACGKSPTAS